MIGWIEAEAQVRHAELLHDTYRLQHRAEWDHISKFERLQRSIRVARARLGLRPVPID